MTPVAAAKTNESSKVKGSNNNNSSEVLPPAPKASSPTRSTSKTKSKGATDNSKSASLQQRCVRSAAAESPRNTATTPGGPCLDGQTASTSSPPAPKPATSAKSPLKVDILNHNATVPALVSPIWPKHLENNVQEGLDNNLPTTLKLPTKNELQQKSLQADILQENTPGYCRRRRHASDAQTGLRSQCQTPGKQNISPTTTRLSRKRKNSLDSALASLPISKRLRSRPPSARKRMKPILAHRTRQAVRSSAFGRS